MRRRPGIGAISRRRQIARSPATDDRTWTRADHAFEPVGSEIHWTIPEPATHFAYPGEAPSGDICPQSRSPTGQSLVRSANRGRPPPPSAATTNAQQPAPPRWARQRARTSKTTQPRREPSSPHPPDPNQPKSRSRSNPQPAGIAAAPHCEVQPSTGGSLSSGPVMDLAQERRPSTPDSAMTSSARRIHRSL